MGRTHGGPRDTDHIARGTRESLQKLLRDGIHFAIEPWMSAVNEREMRGILRFLRSVQPDGVADVGMKRHPKNIPTTVKSPPRFNFRSGAVTPFRTTGGMISSSSAPCL